MGFFQWEKPEKDDHRIERRAALTREMEEFQTAKRRLEDVITEFEQTMDGLKRDRK